MPDLYLTVATPASARLTVKMSRFLAFIHPVSDAAQARALVKDYMARYHDARHVCWAYMLGPDRTEWQLSDNGEPSGTAGRPILGQINSHSLTDVIIIVVRYFGGIKLGTPGLIAAYKEAASGAIEAAEVVERCDMGRVLATFPYEAMNSVMRIAKTDGVEMVAQDFDLTCRLTLAIRRSEVPGLIERLEGIDSVKAEAVN